MEWERVESKVVSRRVSDARKKLFWRLLQTKAMLLADYLFKSG